MRRFTLVELMVVLAVISIMAAVLMPKLATARRRARHASWLGIRKSHQIDTRCLAYYTFEADSGTTVTNLASAAEVETIFSPEDLDGTVRQGAVASANHWGKGRFPDKTALFFNGTDVWVDVPYHAVLNEVRDQLSIEAWVYPADNSGIRPILQRGLIPDGFIMFTSAAIGTGFQAGFGFCAVPPLEEHGWWHVVQVYDGDRLSMYVNGELVGTGTNPVAHTGAIAYAPSDCGLSIGGAWGWYWDGMMDGLALYKEALPPVEIRQMYQQGRGR